MPKYLRDHDNGEAVDAICMLTALNIKETRQQKPFLRLEFGDAGGRVAGVMWDGFTEEMTRIPVGTVLRIQGRMEQYDDRPQVIVRMIGRPAAGTWDYSALLPSSERDTGEMLRELDAIIAGISSGPLRALLEAMFGDPELRRAYSTAPAAKRWHQPWIGGLLEHTLNVHSHALAAAKLYPRADRDLVSAGVLLHDIGKIVEYEVENFFETSTRGRLLGHLVIGVEMLDEWLRKFPDLPQETGWQLKHMILSHHGQLEFGSPVLPQTLEAMLVHFADDLDSKMSGVLRVYERSLDEPGDWTEMVRLMERRFFKGQTTDNGDYPGPRTDSPLPQPPRAKPRRETGGEQRSLLGDEE